MLLRLMCGMLWVPTGLFGPSILGVMHVCDPKQSTSSTCVSVVSKNLNCSLLKQNIWTPTPQQIKTVSIDRMPSSMQNGMWNDQQYLRYKVRALY